MLPVRHDHKLKALTIKKAQTHVIGSPLLSLQGTPVFMDVEGMPDRSFYYLIGLRYDLHGTPVERSFWADKREDEASIWRECLCALKEVDNPQIVHYGAYENCFLKHMRERWKPAAEDAELLDRLINESVNLLRACLSVQFQGLTPTAQYWPSASSRLWPARPAALCLPDPCGLGSDSHGGKVFWATYWNSSLKQALSLTHARIYFPSYSNSLKDTA